MKESKLVLSFPVVAAVLAACAGTTSSNPGTAESTQAIASTYCNAYAQHYGACDKPNERDACLTTDGQCAAKRFTAKAIDDFSRCMTRSGCTAGSGNQCQCEISDDGCFAEAAKSAVATPHRDAYESACRHKIDECGKGGGGTDGGVHDDWCTSGDFGWELLTDAAYDAIAPCFSGACASVDTCVRDKVKALCL